MATVTAVSEQYSLAEFLALPETKPASEYINGKIYQKPMPQGKHSTLQGRLVTEISRVGQPEKLVYAFPELRCTFGDRSLVPDVAVFEWANIPVDENGEIQNQFTVAPDWVIEILSPEQNPPRVIEKILFSLQQGTQLAWLIAPEDYSVTIFYPDKLAEFKEQDDPLPVLPAIAPWQLTATELFTWLRLV
ncbi:Uma2 family endonuclease [Synechococcus moorigangaii CMS01]|nr:Uma2 family endonuclease [Synechococcus moorigangaii CMS01]